MADGCPAGIGCTVLCQPPGGLVVVGEVGELDALPVEAPEPAGIGCTVLCQRSGDAAGTACADSAVGVAGVGAALVAAMADVAAQRAVAISKARIMAKLL